jgi:hypothetical protein
MEAAYSRKCGGEKHETFYISRPIDCSRGLFTITDSRGVPEPP